MTIPFKRSLPKIDEKLNKYMEFADQIYEKKTINQKQIDEILINYNRIKKFDETNLLQSTLDLENKIKEIKEIKNIVYKQKCLEQINSIRRILKNKIKVNDYKNEYEICIRILLVLLRNKISLITNEPLTIQKKVELIKPIQTRIPKAHNNEIQEMLILQKKFNQESSDRRFAIRKQQEYDRIMAQKIQQVYNMEQQEKEKQEQEKQEQEDRDLALAYYYKDHPYASAITRLTRKRKLKPKRKTPKKDKKLKNPVKKDTREKKRKKKRKQRKERDTKKK